MKKNDPFAALMTVAQDQQGYFTTKQAIEAGAFSAIAVDAYKKRIRASARTKETNMRRPESLKPVTQTALLLRRSICCCFFQKSFHGVFFKPKTPPKPPVKTKREPLRFGG